VIVARCDKPLADQIAANADVFSRGCQAARLLVKLQLTNEDLQ
jgi:hypothetical protein